MVNPQYVFKNLTDSLNNLLDANPSKSKYLVDFINNFSKAFQKPLCLAASTLKVRQYHWTEFFNRSQMFEMSSNRIVPSPITANQDHSTNISDNNAMVCSKLWINARVFIITILSLLTILGLILYCPSLYTEHLIEEYSRRHCHSLHRHLWNLPESRTL